MVKTSHGYIIPFGRRNRAIGHFSSIEFMVYSLLHRTFIVEVSIGASATTKFNGPEVRYVYSALHTVERGKNNERIHVAVFSVSIVFGEERKEIATEIYRIPEDEFTSSDLSVAHVVLELYDRVRSSTSVTGAEVDIRAEGIAEAIRRDMERFSKKYSRYREASSSS